MSFRPSTWLGSALFMPRTIPLRWSPALHKKPWSDWRKHMPESPVCLQPLLPQPTDVTANNPTPGSLSQKLPSRLCANGFVVKAHTWHCSVAAAWQPVGTSWPQRIFLTKKKQTMATDLSRHKASSTPWDLRPDLTVLESLWQQIFYLRLRRGIWLLSCKCGSTPLIAGCWCSGGSLAVFVFWTLLLCGHDRYNMLCCLPVHVLQNTAPA